MTNLLLLLALVGQAPTGDFPASLLKWAPDPTEPIFRGGGDDSWDRKIRERGWILFHDGRFHLWYTGYNDARSKLRLLGHATSPDGVTWTRDPSNPIFAGSWVEDMCVVPHQGGFQMFAEGERDQAHRLTSPDGVHWRDEGSLDIRTTKGEPIPPGPFGTPTAWVEGGTWFLLYERGDQGVWLARSTDLKTWTNASDDPVLPRGPAEYDREAVAVNQVVKRDGVYYAFYHANAKRPWADWTTCIARSTDLTHWEKFAGNPILDANVSSGILVDDPTGSHFFTMHPEVRRFEAKAP